MSELAELLKKSETQFARFIREAKISPERLLTKSHELESLRPEDREIKRAKRASAGKDDDAAKAARAKKPRSGRPVTPILLRKAINGESIPGPAKTRLVRVVNALRAEKKQPETDLRALFLKSKG